MSVSPATAAKTTLRIVTRRELADPHWQPGWVDPQGLAAFTPGKKRLVLSNPFAQGDDDPVQIIGLQSNRVVGRMDVLAGRLDVRGAGVPILWTSNLIVPPEFRSTLVGLTIVLKYQALHHTVAACAVSRMVHPLYEKLRWIDFRMPRYLWLRRSRPIVQRYVGSGMLGGAARIAADAGLLAHRALLAAWRRLRTSRLHCTPEPRMTSDFDEKLNVHAEPFATSRTAAFVNWIVDNALFDDARNRRGLFYVRDRENQVLAYFVVTARFHERATHREFPNLLLGSFKDWFIFEPTRVTLSQLVLLAMGVASAWNVDAMEVCLPDPAQVPLRRWGFARTGELNLLVKAGRGSPLDPVGSSDPRQWWFRPADGDNAFG